MRRVAFYIDDLEYFRKSYNLTDEQMKDIFADNDSFKVVYTLYGEKNNIDHYALTDHDGNKIDIKSLNGYQKGVILNDCFAYFNGGKYFNDEKEPCGVMRIEEDVVEECQCTQ